MYTMLIPSLMTPKTASKARFTGSKIGPAAFSQAGNSPLSQAICLVPSPKQVPANRAQGSPNGYEVKPLTQKRRVILSS